MGDESPPRLCPHLHLGSRTIMPKHICTERSVKTEVHPAGDSPVTSGRSFGRGSSGKNSEYSVLTGPPVLAGAPAINRSFDQM